MERRALIAILLVAALALGCDPYHFSMNSSSSLDGTILSKLGTVKASYYRLELLPEGAAQLSVSGRTQLDLAAYVKVSHGKGFRILLRPVVEDKLLDSGLVLTFFNSGGMRLDSAGTTLIENKNFRFPVDSEALVRIYNEEGYVQAIVGCDTVVKRMSGAIASDDLVFSTLDSSTLRITIPEWRKISFPKSGEINTGGIPAR